MPHFARHELQSVIDRGGRDLKVGVGQRCAPVFQLGADLTEDLAGRLTGG